MSQSRRRGRRRRRRRTRSTRSSRSFSSTLFFLALGANSWAGWAGRGVGRGAHMWGGAPGRPGAASALRRGCDARWTHRNTPFLVVPLRVLCCFSHPGAGKTPAREHFGSRARNMMRRVLALCTVRYKRAGYTFSFDFVLKPGALNGDTRMNVTGLHRKSPDHFLFGSRARNMMRTPGRWVREGVGGGVCGCC